uniref:DEF6 guanine nucleotide exchange factor n=1 Tax=Eptatretus burgeri TaxID=7764 RepID=A0A8C4QUP7_EPTBU
MYSSKVEFLLRKLTTAMGAQWQEDSAEVGPLASIIGQNGQELSVWELVALIDLRPLAPGADRLALTLAIDEVYQELLMDIIKKGYLWKKGHKRKNWMERYFLLKSNIISYYVHEDLKEKKGEIVLDKVCNVMPIPDKDGRRFLFLISCFGKSFEISAPDPRQRQAWISSIQSVIRVLEIGNVSVARDMQRRRREQRERRGEERDQLAQRMTDLKEEQERSRQQLENLQQSQHESEMRALVEEQKRAQAHAELQEKYELELLHDKKVIAEMEVEIKAKEVETKAHQERIRELEEMYQQLSAALEMERQAKHEEEAAHELQARLLHDEACKREELERLQEEQEQELSVTRREKAELERESITRQQALENANQQLQKLEAEREEAQRKHQEVSEKLASASTCTQSWRDRVKRCEMLLRPICPGEDSL